MAFLRRLVLAGTVAVLLLVTLPVPASRASPAQLRRIRRASRSNTSHIPNRPTPCRRTSLPQAIALNKIRVVAGYCRLALGPDRALVAAGFRYGCAVRRMDARNDEAALAAGAGVLRRSAGHSRRRQSAARRHRARGQPALRHQRAGLGELVWRPGQGTGRLARCRRAGCAASSTGSCACRRGATGFGSG